MSKRRPIRANVHAGPEPDAPSAPDPAGTGGDVAPERFREALAWWASTVTLVAVEEQEAPSREVHATTVTSFAPVSAEPPQVMLALGAGARVLPFLEVGGVVGVSLLAEDQRRWATIFADAFAVAEPTWSEGAAPLLVGAAVALTCVVQSVHPAEGGATIVLCRVRDVAPGDTERPLLYWNRSYARLDRP